MATRVWLALPFAVLAAALPGCAHPGSGQVADHPQSADTTHPANRNPSTVTSVDSRVAANEPIEMALEGKVPGLEVTRTSDGYVAIRIHGPSSFFGSGEPLYVLDGIPITPGPNGRISGLFAKDIESIQVLKDPSETALYGVRGGNGVIVIKTKQASSRPKQ
ncbi:MAG TPA: TonB-dependent receptor plug domain-containing protein [Gemmatimonadales bacterium]|nr:TonB-dependent receptor plug domain-containing protein [Gemmatimonadales bacterium]